MTPSSAPHVRRQSRAGSVGSPGWSPLLLAATVYDASTPAADDYFSKEHARNGSASASGSGSRDARTPSSREDARTTTATTTTTTTTTTASREHDSGPRREREKDKKTMLSRALQKANTAVLLDNAQNFEGAMEAYADACQLLQHVMVRSSHDDDRRKLDAIRVTYTNRIDELRRLDPGEPQPGKSLPARPMSGESLDEQRSMLLDDEPEADVEIHTATAARIVNEHPDASLPLRAPRESVISTAIRDVQRTMQTPFHLQPPPARPAPPDMDRSYMPPPLSPKRSRSPLSATLSATLPAEPFLLQPAGHQRARSSESTSWLDTIDESGGSSCSSSVHSLSPRGVRRKHLRNPSGGTEAEFDAALDAAVEAAYDDGFEPFDLAPDELLSTRLRNVELAKERVREAERDEAIAAAKFRFNESLQMPHVRESELLNDEAEEEERLLDEMTREYMLDGFDFDLQTKSSLPRQSNSSGFTYNSSVSSHRTTAGTSLSAVAGTSLSTVAEVQPLRSPPAMPAPSTALPALPPPPPAALPSVPELQAPELVDAEVAPEVLPDPEVTPRPTTATKDGAKDSVRSRRLSHQNAKSLKIETSLPAVAAPPHTDKPPVPAKNSPLEQPKTAAVDTFKSQNLDAFKSENLNVFKDTLKPSALQSWNDEPGSPKSKPSTLGIRKNKSSLSLKQRTLSISSPDGSDASIGTPLSTTFSITGRKPSVANIAPLPTPGLPTFSVDGLPSGGMHLFESDIHSPFSPGSPSPVANAPIPLEPCPETYLLRPFWLMRCFYQTIVHPRGGYLSTKLFIPRDVWRVKGVKIKNMEDKIANCDLLTAALQKMASMDTLDADAVLEEMLALEAVLDQVQGALAKKLGNEVGVQSASTLFKEAGDGPGTTDSTSRAVAQGKSYLTSWRKLRSKNSGVNLASLAPREAKDALVMATLPMTSVPTMRFAKRDTSGVTFEGPNAAYMSSLARLFDAVQILDQIARQVEDPGLKHSSQTHVGLELSSRHAAEFFGFYICRFVLADVAGLLDKFIKRGSEWVLV